MFRAFLFLVALFAMCSPPTKTYNKPEIGMDYVHDFRGLCGLSPDTTHTLTTEKDDTLTITNQPTDYKGDARPAECVGTFTFVNNKLTTISR